MNKRQKSMVGMVMALIAAGLFLPALISGGDLEPGAPPGQTMHTLDEIYGLAVGNCPEPVCPDCDSAPVAATGRTTSTGAGDDGDLQKGVPWPNPRFTDNGDGTVTDNLTGLVWLKDVDCFFYSSTERTWVEALAFCNALASGSCGLSDGSSPGDWRLPNIKELHSLRSSSVFSSQFGNRRWSSTTVAWSSSRAWIVDFGDVSVTHVGKDSRYTVELVPVRGGN